MVIYSRLLWFSAGLTVSQRLIVIHPKLTEGNGILKPMFDVLGVLPTLVVVKLGFIGLLFWAAPQVPVEVLYALIVFYSWVVFNNVKLIRGR